jgi:hypothetical protein
MVEQLMNSELEKIDSVYGLVVRVSGYRSRGPGFDYRPYQIFWEVGGLEHEDSWGANWMKK